jgi:hypothetical protein
MEKQRSDLRIMFRDGARPTGNDFTDAWDSFVHRTDDGFIINTTNGTKVNNFTLGAFSAVPVAGSMRFTAGEVQFFDGAAWKNVSSNNLGFKALNDQPPAALVDAAYFGKIGINLGPAPPLALQDDFEVGIANTVSKARAGTAVIGGNGPGGTRAMFFHSNVRNLVVNGGNVEQNYGFAQNQDGGLFINTVTNQSVIFSTNDTPQLLIRNGRLVVGGTVALVPNPSPPVLDPLAPIMLHVNGHAIKNSGGANWLVTSDVRTKKDITDFKDGLEKIRSLRAVNFKYNGKAGTTDDQEQVGLIGQEVEEVFPYMVRRMENKVSPNDDADYPENMLVLDSSPLVYVLMNAIRELDDKIEQLKKNDTN